MRRARPHPKEFRDDVVAVARRGEAPVSQIAKDFGISDSCLRSWMHAADIEDGNRPGVTASESASCASCAAATGSSSRRVEVLRRATAYLSQAHLPGK